MQSFVCICISLCYCLTYPYLFARVYKRVPILICIIINANNLIKPLHLPLPHLAVPVESEDAQKLRFQVELEFVQCLANPNYLHCKCTGVSCY